MGSNIEKASTGFLSKYGIAKADSTSLSRIIRSQGYTIIRFNNISNSGDADTLIKSLGLGEIAARSKAFTYADSNFRLVFAHEGLNDEELAKVLAHEEGHIWLKHLGHQPILGTDIVEESEANRFAESILSKHRMLALKQLILSHKIAAAVISALFLCVIAAAVIGVVRVTDGSRQTQYYVTETGSKYHEKDCIFVKDKENVRQITKEELNSGEYAPCKVCLP